MLRLDQSTNPHHTQNLQQPKKSDPGCITFSGQRNELVRILKMPIWDPVRFARLIFFGPAPAMLRALPCRDQEDRAATERIAQKQGGHFPISLVLDRIGHRRRMRGEKQGPRPKRNGFRATLVLGRLDDLRDVGQEAKAVEKRKHGERGVCDRHAKAAAWSVVGRPRRLPCCDMFRLPRLPRDIERHHCGGSCAKPTSRSLSSVQHGSSSVRLFCGFRYASPPRAGAHPYCWT